MARARLPLAALAVAALACSLSPAVELPAPTLPPAPLPTAGVIVAAPSEPLPAPRGLNELYERVNPGVVTIYVFGPSTDVPDGQGSGFVIDAEGHIVTNQHVIQGADEIEVDFASGFRAWATLLGTDPDSDLAVLQVSAPTGVLVPIPLGDSDSVQVGEQVIAIGNPFGFSGTMTVGVVSAIGRVLQSEHQAPGGGTFSAGDLIQTDAAINPGNSGGPLLNLSGQVIGVNRAITTETFSATGSAVNSGVGFAIPVNIVRRVVPAIIQSGSYAYPYLGITSLGDSNLNLRQLEILELPPNTVGVYVTCVVDNGPAERAGLVGAGPCGASEQQPGGDLITAIDGHPVFSFSDLISYLVTEVAVGDEVVLTVLRDGTSVEVTLILEPRP